MSQNPSFNIGDLAGGWGVRRESTTYALVAAEGGVHLETNVAVAGAGGALSPLPPGNFRHMAGELAGGWTVHAETNLGKTFATPAAVLLVETYTAPAPAARRSNQVIMMG